MDALEAIFTRRSIRRYRPEPVPMDLVNQLLAAGMSAPSAMNIRPWQFIVITERKIMDEIPKFHPYSAMLRSAPLVLCVCGDITASEKYWVLDCSAAAENILIAARALGLGAVWLAVYPVESRIMNLKELLRLPENIVPLCLIAVGYPAEEKPRSAGRDEARVHYNEW